MHEVKLIVRRFGLSDGASKKFESVKRFDIFLPRKGAALKRPISSLKLAKSLAGLAGNQNATGKILALGGDEIVSLRSMAESILHARGVHKIIWTLPETPLRITASLSEWVSRLLRKKISWISHQSLDGLVFDAVPEVHKE